MVAAVRVHKHGGPEALTYEDIEIPAPGQGQIKIKTHAAGINFIDTYFRMGAYPSPVGMPFIAGNESAGEVIAVGPGVTDLKIGDRVAYVGPLGTFVSFGSASGQIDAFNINILQTKGSLFATRPTLNHYAAKREDLVSCSSDLFEKVGSGAVKIPVNQKYPLKDAAKAHQELEGRDTTGSSILVP